jgi:hypothetical protein
LAAVINAIVDLLAEPGVNHIEMPGTPSGLADNSRSYALGKYEASSSMRQDRIAFSGGVGSWCKRAQWVLRKLKTVPMAMRVAMKPLTGGAERNRQQPRKYLATELGGQPGFRRPTAGDRKLTLLAPVTRRMSD